MTRRRLTRKEIVQEDQIHSALDQTFRFVLENRNLLLIALGSVVVVAVAFYFWADQRAVKKAEIQHAFGQAQEIFWAPTGEVPTGDTVAVPDSTRRYATASEKYEAALSAFADVGSMAADTTIAEYARYYEALCQRGLGRSQEYVQTMEALAAGDGSTEMRSLAALSLGDHYLGNGDIAKAREYFEIVLQDAESNLPKDKLLNQVAQYYEKEGDRQQTREILERLVKEYPDSRLRSQAESKLTELSPDPKP